MSTKIQPDDIIGRRLVDVFTLTSGDGGMDNCDCLLVLETGLVFRIPAFSDEPFVAAEMPMGAMAIQHSKLDGVCGQTVVRLLRPRSDDEFWPGTVYLGLSSGKWLKHEPAMPQGLGAAGLHVLDSKDMVFTELMDFWQ
jgi:hypothetical protein